MELTTLTSDFVFPTNLMKMKKDRAAVMSYFERILNIRIGKECKELILNYCMQMIYVEIIKKNTKLTGDAVYWRIQIIKKTLPYDFLVFYNLFGEKLRTCVRRVGNICIENWNRGLEMKNSIPINACYDCRIYGDCCCFKFKNGC